MEFALYSAGWLQRHLWLHVDVFICPVGRGDFMLALATDWKSSATEAGENRFMLPLGVLQLLAIDFIVV